MLLPLRAGVGAARVGALGLGVLALVAGCGSVEQATTKPGGGVITGAGGGPGATSSSSGTGTWTGAGGSGGAGSEGLGPPYPIVLAHGFFGFEQFAGQDFATYFYEVRETLGAEGEVIHTTAVDPFNSSTHRGAQLLERIEAILAETGHAKVNLIGHSQGGLDARVVAHHRPDLVASVITIGTPHRGSKVADVVLQLVDDPMFQDVVDELAQLIGAPLYDEVGHQTSVIAALEQFSGPGIAAFNDKYTDAEGVFYASLTGRTDWSSGGSACDTADEELFVTEFGGVLDPVNAVLSVSEAIVDGGLGQSIPNDGLVRVEDAKWGRFWGCVPADHLDEVGHLFGQSPGLGNDWKYLDFYRALVARIRAEGL